VVCNGGVVFPPRGTNGFGYAPIFVANGMDKTFAEMSNEERNKINHRFLAIQKFIEFLSVFKTGYGRHEYQSHNTATVIVLELFLSLFQSRPPLK
jgi:hypothetical protein